VVLAPFPGGAHGTEGDAYGRKEPAGDPLAQATANPARVYDYLLGGKTNLAADRHAAEQLIKAKPDLLANVQANRRFLGRAVQHLA
jgi:S-adenosyl methyltransferase